MKEKVQMQIIQQKDPVEYPWVEVGGGAQWYHGGIVASTPDSFSGQSNGQ